MNQVKAVTGGLVVLALLAGAGVVYKHFTKKPPVEIQALVSQVKKKVTKRKIPQANGAAPIEEEIIEDEKLDAFVNVNLQKRNHLLGLTLSYDEGIKYNLIFGKAVIDHLYVVGKVQTNLSKAEAGILYVF